MNYMTAVCTDVGTRRKTNQDSLLIRAADTDYGGVLLGVICDGMGGLAKGEVASSTMIRAFAWWFGEQLPLLLEKGFETLELRDQWEFLIRETSQRISEYGLDHHLSLGTTLAAILLMEGRYYIVSVGDSRIYQITDQVYQLTKDQTYVQREVDLGHMTPEEAAVDSRRNILLQCIGASSIVIPDYHVGEYQADTVFMLCCDGFRHVVTPEEFRQRLNPRVLRSEEEMTRTAAELTRLNLQRGETDNITVGLVRVC